MVAFSSEVSRAMLIRWFGVAVATTVTEPPPLGSVIHERGKLKTQSRPNGAPPQLIVGQAETCWYIAEAETFGIYLEA